MNTSRCPLNTSHRQRDERGAGTMLILAVMIAGLALGLALVLVGGYRAAASRARSGADSVALSGAFAVQAGGDGCAAARRAAPRNGVRLEKCDQVGDAIDFVVSVSVSAPVDAPVSGLPTKMTAAAHAGRIT